MPGPIDKWRRVNWAWPVPQIAARLGVSRQRVYQVIEERGIRRPPRPSIQERLIALDTAPLTLREITEIVGGSGRWARAVLRAAGKAYRRRPGPLDGPYAAFAAWLAQRYDYLPGTVSAHCRQCRRVERVYGLQLADTLFREGGVAAVLTRMRAAPDALLLPGTRPVMLNSYCLAIRRYAEFLALGIRRTEALAGAASGRRQAVAARHPQQM